MLNKYHYKQGDRLLCIFEETDDVNKSKTSIGVIYTFLYHLGAGDINLKEIPGGIFNGKAFIKYDTMEEDFPYFNINILVEAVKEQVAQGNELNPYLFAKSEFCFLHKSEGGFNYADSRLGEKKWLSLKFSELTKLLDPVNIRFHSSVEDKLEDKPEDKYVLCIKYNRSLSRENTSAYFMRIYTVKNDTFHENEILLKEMPGKFAKSCFIEFNRFYNRPVYYQDGINLFDFVPLRIMEACWYQNRYDDCLPLDMSNLFKIFHFPKRFTFIHNVIDDVLPNIEHVKVLENVITDAIFTSKSLEQFSIPSILESYFVGYTGTPRYSDEALNLNITKTTNNKTNEKRNINPVQNSFSFRTLEKRCESKELRGVAVQYKPSKVAVTSRCVGNAASFK